MARLHLPPERLTGERLTLDGEAHRYLARVLAVGPRGTELELGRRRQVDRKGPVITLLQGIAKGDKMDLVVQKTTELGVARILPVLARRSVARAEGARQRRWQLIASEAARQCGRADLPVVEAPLALSAALAALDSCEPPGAARRVLWERCREPSLHGALTGKEPGATLLVGPEGGWEEEEIDAARAAGFLPVGVGPRILRAETAAIVAVALAQAALGGLGS